MDQSEHVRAANTNAIAAWDRLRLHYRDPRGARRRFGAVQAVAVGVDSAFFNPVFALDPESSIADVIAALDWVESLGLPASVAADAAVSATIDRALADHGLHPSDERTAVMTLELGGPVRAPALPPSGDPSIAVRTGGIELAADWWAAIEASERMRALFGEGLISDPDVRIAVGALAGEPVAGAMVIRSGDVLGVYAVWTAERARRRGIGRAVTGAAIRAGIDAWRSRIAILHSTVMGFPVYVSLGFEEVGSIVLYVRPRPETT